MAFYKVICVTALLILLVQECHSQTGVTTTVPPTTTSTTTTPNTTTSTTTGPTTTTSTTTGPTTTTSTTTGPTTTTSTTTGPTTTTSTTTGPTTTTSATTGPTTTTSATTGPTTTNSATTAPNTTTSTTTGPTTTTSATTGPTTTNSTTTGPNTTNSTTTGPNTTNSTTTGPNTTNSTTTGPNTTTSIVSPQPVFCGQAALNTRILGANSTAGSWPWMVSLQRNGSHVCGGTVVAVDSVLSSADCFSSSSNPSDWTVVLGLLSQLGSNPNKLSLTVTNITLSNLTGSNVAVLRLASRPTLSSYIQPICLGTTQTFAVGSTCWAAGWSPGRGGADEALQETQATVVDCGNLSTSDSICTELITLDQGDSGGPIMCRQDGSWFQAAVLTPTKTNFTTRARAAQVMVFTKISTYEKFLAQTLGIFLSPASSNTTTNTTATTTALTTTGGTSAHTHFFCLYVLILCLTFPFYLL